MENKKKNNTLLIVVIVVISLFLVGTLAYFAYDKIFKEDKPVEKNKDNKDNGDKTGVKMNSSYDNSTILKSLVDIRYIVENDYYDETMFKIDENKKLVVTYYDEEEKDVTKRFDEIGNVTKIIHYGNGSGMAIIFTESNEIYFFYAYDDEDKIKKIDNNTGKKPKAKVSNSNDW